MEQAVVLIFNRIYISIQAGTTFTTNLKTMQWESNMAKAWNRKKRLYGFEGQAGSFVQQEPFM